MAKVNPIQLQKPLKGMDYPVFLVPLVPKLQLGNPVQKL
jgi:hypothetical protein